jgi:hypothetical protein
MLPIVVTVPPPLMVKPAKFILDVPEIVNVPFPV